MVGLITEQHLAQAEEVFPGIGRFFAACSCKPRTFLELVALYERWCPCNDEDPRPTPASRS
jgi:hypothetical protein